MLCVKHRFSYKPASACSNEVVDYVRGDLTEDELAFQARVERGWELVRLGVSVVADESPMGEQRNKLPFRTVWRLHLSLGARCLAALQNLVLPQTSEAALVLLRNCIEAYAHLEFMKGLPGANGNTTCRALQYELGELSEAWSTVKKIDPDNLDIDSERDQRRAALLREETGCACLRHAGLRREHVPVTLKSLAKEIPGHGTLTILYSDASRSTHMFSGDDHLLSPGPSGATELTWVSFAKRAGWLAWLMLVFGNATWASEFIILGEGGTSQLACSGWSERTQDFINDPELERLSSP